MSDAPDHRPVSLEKNPAAAGGPDPAAPDGTQAPEGCLAVVVRIPVRIVTVLLVLPVRMLWDALTACGRVLQRSVWRPVARGARRVWETVLAPVLYALFVWPWTALWSYVLAPVGRCVARLAGAVASGVATAARGTGAVLAWLGRTLVVVPLAWLYEWVLAPLGRGVAAVVRGVGAGVVWLGRYGVVVPGRAVWSAVVWLVGVLVVTPAVWLYEWVLAPLGRAAAVVGREVADALGHAWRVAGRVSLGVYRFFAAVFRLLVGAPAVWAWRNVVLPAGHGLRDHVWRPVAEAAREAGRSVRAACAAARETVRHTRAEVRRALFGAPAQPERRPQPREGRVPWGAGSPHSRAKTPYAFGEDRDDADFRTL